MTGHRTHSFLCWLIQKQRPVTWLATVPHLAPPTLLSTMKCKTKWQNARPRLPILRLTQCPMFFLEGWSLFWYRLIGAIPPGGITGLRIKGGKCFHKMRKRNSECVKPSPVGFRNTHSRTKIFSVKDTILYWTKRWEIMVFMLLAVSFKGH